MSAQIVHSSSSARLKQREHGRIRSLTSRIASASALASAGDAFEQVEREPLRRAPPDARQARELSDQVVD